MKLKDLGQLVATRAVADLQESNQGFDEFLRNCLGRYLNHDWGDLVEEDKWMSDQAVTTIGNRIMGSYEFPDDATWIDDALNMYGGKERRIWIITGWDRSVTTILFPSEY